MAFETQLKWENNMGYYINPPDITKEQFLKEHGEEKNIQDFKSNDFISLDKLGKYHVVLVDNVIFTAGVICYSQNEYDYIKKSLNDDPRPKRFFFVQKLKLKPYLE